MADASGGRVLGRPRLCWMDDMKVAFGWDDPEGLATMPER